MALFRTVAAESEPLTVSECKAYLRITHADDDPLISGLIRAAREEVEQQTGTAMIDQAWRLTLDGWPTDRDALLSRHPVREILSVTAFGEDGEASLIDPAIYRLDSGSRPARLGFGDPPAAGIAANGLEIDFRAGYGESGADVPDLLKRAMMLLVAHWYEFRGVYGAKDQPVSVPDAVGRLIAGYRSRRLL